MAMVFSKKQYTLAATALGSSLAFIDATAVIVALPTMQKALNLGLSGEQWIFLSYSLALAALYLVSGALGDRWGHRKVFSLGVVGFAAASILAGLSPNGTFLIAARVLQGIAGALVTTNSLACLRSAYGDQAGKAVGLWTSLTGISTVIAPLLGGALTQWLSWRYIFYINVPLAALVLFLVTRAVEDKKEASPRPLDTPGSALIAAVFGFLTYFFVQGAKAGFARLWWSLVAGLVSLIVFLLVEARIKHPMLPPHLLKIRNFVAANLETFILYGALSGLFIYFTLYLQFLGLSPLGSSLFLIPASLALIFLATYFGKLADNQGPRLYMTIGPFLIGISALIFSFIQTKTQVWLIGVPGIAIFSLGLAMMVAPLTTAALKSISTEYAGLASGINNTVSRIGGLMAIALVGMLISIIFYSSGGNKQAVPLDLHQTDSSLRQASVEGYRAGMWLVGGLALGSSAIGWFGIDNKALKAKST